MFGGSRYKNHQQKRIYIVAVEKNRCRKWKKKYRYKSNKEFNSRS